MALLRSISLNGETSSIPTKLSQFENDPGFVTEAQLDLDNYYNKQETDALLDDKQDTLTAGENIDITNGVISATDTTYTAGTDIDITNGVISSTIDTSEFATTTALAEGLAEKADAATTYTKAETDALLGDKADTNGVYTKTETDGLLDAKADAASVYTKTEADNLLDAKADQATTYTKTEVDGLLDDKADASSVYTKSEVDEALDDKADATSVYTKSETDTLLNDKADAADVYTKTETDTLLDDKADVADVYTKTETDTLLDAKADQATTYTKTEVDDLINNIDTGRFEVVQQLPQTGEDKVIYLVPKQGGGYTEYVWIEDDGAFEEIGDTDIDLSDYYTKSETDALLDDKADANTVYTKTETDNLLDDKADATSVYTKTETDDLLDAKADAATTYTKTEVDTALAGKANQATTYTKTEVDNLLDDKADAATTYTKSETDTLLNDKANTADVYTKTQTDTLLAGKQGTLTSGGANVRIENDTVETTDYTFAPGAFDANNALDAVSVTATDTLDGGFRTFTNVEVGLNTTKSPAAGSDPNDVLATKKYVDDELSLKQDTLTAGNHITIAQDGTISATGMTKQEILTELGYDEITLSTTTDQGTVTAHVLGYVDAPVTPEYLLEGDVSAGDVATVPMSSGETSGSKTFTSSNSTLPSDVTLGSGNSVKVSTAEDGDGILIYGDQTAETVITNDPIEVTGELTSAGLTLGTFNSAKYGTVTLTLKATGDPITAVTLEVTTTIAQSEGQTLQAGGITVEILDHGQ